MDRNLTIYHPYRVIADQPERLELAISSGREKFLFIFFRMVPVMFIAFAFMVYKIMGPAFRGSSDTGIFSYLYSGVLVLTAVIIAVQSFIVRVIFTAERISLIVNAFPGFRREVTANIRECESIFYTITGGRGGGGFIYVRMKNGKKIQVVNIPILYLDRNAIPKICDDISIRTGLAVEKQ